MILEVIAALIIHGILKGLFAGIGGASLALWKARKSGDLTTPDEKMLKRGTVHGIMAYYIIALVVILVVAL